MAIRLFFVTTLLCLLAACASTSQPVIYKPEPTTSTPLPASQSESKAAVEAELAAQLREQERLMAEEKAKAEAVKAEAAKKAAQEAQVRRAPATKPEEQSKPRQAAGGVASGSNTTTGTKSAAPATDKKAAEIAKQQAKIAELRKKIATNKAETAKLESANASLKQAITAAESLNKTLSSEQQKYKDSDPRTGKTQEPLAKSKIDELTAEVERLQKEAATLTGKPAK